MHPTHSNSLERSRSVRRATWSQIRASISSSKNNNYPQHLSWLQEFREAVARRESAAEECARGWAAAAEVRARAARLRAREEAERSMRELRAAWDRQLEDKRRRQSQLLDHDNCHRKSAFVGRSAACIATGGQLNYTRWVSFEGQRGVGRFPRDFVYV